MKYAITFEEFDWEAVVGLDLLYLNEFLFVEGVPHHVEAWRVDDLSPVTAPAPIEDRVGLLRRATDPDVSDEPWQTVTIRGRSYGIVITPVTIPGGVPVEEARG